MDEKELLESSGNLSDNAYVIEEEHLSEPERPLPRVALEDLPPALAQAARKVGWNRLMPVQSLALPYLLQGEDIMVQSRTGSGKTGAFLLPALARMDPRLRSCQAMVLTPTRELALQVAAEAGALFASSGLETAALYGGVGYAIQNEALKRGAHLVVGTPGRVLDHLLRRNFTLDDLRLLVFDEADRMLSVGFYPDMKEVQRYLPKRRLPVHFFSATFPPQVLRMAGEFMARPALLSLSREQVHHMGDMEHLFYQVRTMEKDRALVRILEMESPGAAIVFCNTKADVHYVTAVLRGFGFNADELSADLAQSRREEVLAQLRAGALRFLVATDVAARGIDIPELTHVVLYSPPEDPESYIHRAGRTGRAGAGGTVISLVDIMEKMELARIARHFKIVLTERELPDESDLARVVGERLAALLEGNLRKKTDLEQERMRRFSSLAAELAGDEDSVKLLCLLLDETYQASLHTPPPQPAVSVRPAGVRAAAGQDGREAGDRRRRRRRGRPGKAAEGAGD
ncbi:MAG: DEAD/DEAH box helicase [Deltaproteobacteria bacterium]|nr:DEAD/DEAH box helicase [Deltaproteobacteria bacterium]